MADLGIGFDWSRSRDVVGIGAFFQASPSPGGFVSLCATGYASVRGPPDTCRASGTRNPPLARSGSDDRPVPNSRAFGRLCRSLHGARGSGSSRRYHRGAGRWFPWFAWSRSRPCERNPGVRPSLRALPIARDRLFRVKRVPPESVGAPTRNRARPIPLHGRTGRGCAPIHHGSGRVRRSAVLNRGGQADTLERGPGAWKEEGS